MGIPAYTDVNTTAVFTVAGLPVAAAVGAGARAFVNDANAATFNTLLAAGGANKVPVFSDGAAWRIGWETAISRFINSKTAPNY